MSPAAAGCSRTHSAVTLGDWSDPLDPDAEIQMVYRQLLLGRDQLRWVPRASHFPRCGQPAGCPATPHGHPCPFIHSFPAPQLTSGAGREGSRRGRGGALGPTLVQKRILDLLISGAPETRAQTSGVLPFLPGQRHHHSATEIWSKSG